MVLKRMKKLEGMKKEMDPPEMYPAEKADIVLVGWGSTYGAMKEAAELLNSEGLATQMVHFSEVFPFPSKDFLKHWESVPGYLPLSRITRDSLQTCSVSKQDLPCISQDPEI